MMMKMILLVIWILGSRVANANANANPNANAKEERNLVKWAANGEERLSTVVIAGKLLCTAKPSAHPYPVSGASIGVFCGTSGRRRKSWAKGSTNSYGEFLVDLPSHLHAIPNLEKVCVVQVLHLPKSSVCKYAFTGKRKGIKLASISEGLRIYTTTHNIHLMPKHALGKLHNFKQKHTVSVL